MIEPPKLSPELEPVATAHLPGKETRRPGHPTSRKGRRYAGLASGAPSATLERAAHRSLPTPAVH